MTSESSKLGQHLALGVGVAALGGAGVAALTGTGPIVVLICALVGGSALSGWVKARKKS